MCASCLPSSAERSSGTTSPAGDRADSSGKRDNTAGSRDEDLFAAYGRGDGAFAAWDEALQGDGLVRPQYTSIMEKFAALGVDELDQRQRRAEAREEEEGITFRVSGEAKPRIFPLDLFPRIIDAETWGTLSTGLEQRARALNAFLDDVYGPQRILATDILDEADLKRAPGYVDEGNLQPQGSVRANICGMDLVCTDEGKWLVLEDNLRVPSGIIFSHMLRTIEHEMFGDVMAGYDLYDPQESFTMLRETLLSAVPANAHDAENPRIALVSTGESDSAWFEHHRIAELVGMPVCVPQQLAVVDGYLHYRADDGSTHRLDVVYARIDKDTLFSATGFDSQPLGPGLHEALTERRLAFANAFGNGVGDDKAIYAVVPDMIRFYLDEEPLLAQVPTDLCHKPGKVDDVIAHLAERVVKPVDGYGGAGITIGPECSRDDLDERAQQLREHPERFIAQDIVRLSTLPTYGPDTDGRTVVHPRHVDLRVFVHVRVDQGYGDADHGSSISGHHMTAHTVPAALTRTAGAGSLIVNTSRGGGGKDTWILRSPVQSGGADSAAAPISQVTQGEATDESNASNADV